MYRCGVARYVNADGSLGRGATTGSARSRAMDLRGGGHDRSETESTHPQSRANRPSHRHRASGFVGLASPAYANFPHFKSSSVTTVTGTSLASARSATPSASVSVELPDLLFSWTEVGLGSPDVVYRLSTVVTVTFGCVNGGANHPSATNKTTVVVPEGTTVDLKADKNGQITGSVVLDISTVSPATSRARADRRWWPSPRPSPTIRSQIRGTTRIRVTV